MDDNDALREQLLQIIEDIKQTIGFYVGRGAITIPIYDMFIRIIKKVVGVINKLD